MSTYTMPARDVRPGDAVELSPHDYRDVVQSRPYVGQPGPLDGSWVLTVKVHASRWPWSQCPTFQPLADDEGNPYYPEDCTEELTYAPEQMLNIQTDGSVLLHPETLLPVRWWVAVYEIDRGFGGSEEGGWWFDTGELCVSVPCRSKDEADDVAARLGDVWVSEGNSSSITYRGGDYRVWVERSQPAEHFPEHQPHYA